MPYRQVILLSFSVFVSACSNGSFLDNRVQFAVGAPSIKELDGQPFTRQSGDYYIAESLKNCNGYQNRLLFASRETNSALDILSTIFSTLAATFSPISTSHALAAAAAITTGTKSAINADIYMNATAPLMVQAMQETYGKQITELQARNRAENPVSYSEVVAVNYKCSLSQAFVQLQQDATKKGGSDTGGALTAKVAVKGTDLSPGAKFVAPGFTLTITGDVPKADTGKVSFSTQVDGSPSASNQTRTKADLIDFLNKVSAQRKS